MFISFLDGKKTKLNDKTNLDQSTISIIAPKSNNEIEQNKNGHTDSNSSVKRNQRKKKPKKMDKDKENSLPIAQSTFINSVIEDALSEHRKKTLDISELPSATGDESSISSINTVDLKETVMPTLKTGLHKDTTKTKELLGEKVCSM